MEEIKITRTTAPKEKVPSDKLGFGKVFSDHMFLMNYDEGQGWHDPRIVPYGPIELMPCANVLHYAQEIFEGLKAYRTAEGTVQLFRPTENIKRMNNSAVRMCIPQVPEDLYLEALKTIVSVDADLYAPTAAALPLFWDRLSPGGAILVHDAGGTQYLGPARALREFCAPRRILPTPLSDLHGTVLLRKPLE